MMGYVYRCCFYVGMSPLSTSCIFSTLISLHRHECTRRHHTCNIGPSLGVLNHAVRGLDHLSGPGMTISLLSACCTIFRISTVAFSVKSDHFLNWRWENDAFLIH
ncbi:hypothetical protein I3842_02G057500 [Carya illinoinensis]|uniref:Uncharacterized protein n=1 Tax=Carya illinoinensis TaxID=32201 RepID=A0A922FSQ6_CARIL|nr:hypothetical protein I3842_02G057500 [Carya illinoinensis]